MSILVPGESCWPADRLIVRQIEGASVATEAPTSKKASTSKAVLKAASSIINDPLRNRALAYVIKNKKFIDFSTIREAASRITDPDLRNQALADRAREDPDFNSALKIAKLMHRSRTRGYADKDNAFAECVEKTPNPMLALAAARLVETREAKEKAFLRCVTKAPDLKTALEAARLIRDKTRKDKALAACAAKALDPNEASKIAQLIQNEEERDEALEDYARTTEKFEEAFRAAQLIKKTENRQRALGSCVEKAPNFESARKIAVEITDPTLREIALRSCIKKGKTADLKGALETANLIKTDSWRDVALAEYMSNVDTLDAASQAANLIKSPDFKKQMLTNWSLMHRLPP